MKSAWRSCLKVNAVRFETFSQLTVLFLLSIGTEQLATEQKSTRNWFLDQYRPENVAQPRFLLGSRHFYQI
jgi:hypothetical protein